MLIRTASVITRIAARLPLWVPISVERARVGYDTWSYCKISIRRNKQS